MNKIQLISLGCSKNRVDSEHVLKQIAAADGFEIAPEGEDLSKGKVDTVIINTCGFIKDAKQESIDTILEAVEAKKLGYISKIFVFGCLSQRYNAELKTSIPEVDGFFGAFDMNSLLEALGVRVRGDLALHRVLTTPSHYAYLKISEGCDRTCAYCSIPLIRGAHHSVPVEDLVLEAEHLAAMGVKELIVIAQDTTYYGLDIYGTRKLAYLLERLSLVKGIEWIRIHYSYPAGFPDDVLSLMADNPKICKYIDIPLQHSADKVLKMMRRATDARQTRELIEKMRKMVPGVVLRTTMIVGHPGEGKREFEDLLGFVKEYRFERLGAFTYSEEEGTYGAMNYKDTIFSRVKQERYDTLMEIQSAISQEYNMSRIGSRERVLVDSLSDGVLVSRSQSESPEVDGEILIGDEHSLKFVPADIIGNFVNVTIKSAGEYDLLAEII
ncbi:MAG: 30S ribosomal protein S12 methylthiotransferase RimO [Bacteroidales bacterium]|nr:30S ribosomal protein S12 methylthiotransferase RimO [Bacteroidales bacterium]MDD4671136.1 30S ribosomal protein S12 methylthiotransferase RimO [Bacteroidales bacterium]